MRLLVKDDPTKAKAVETLIKGAKDKGINLYLLPVTILEIVWVTEKDISSEQEEHQRTCRGNPEHTRA